MKRFWIIFSLSVLLILFSSATYYIAPTGDDSTGDGSIGNPWLSWAYALTQMTGGDTLYFRGGTYYPTARPYIDAGLSGSLSERTYFGSYPGERAIFDYRNYDAPNNAPPPPHTIGSGYASGISIWISGNLTFENFDIQNVIQVDSFTEVSAVNSYRGYNMTYNNISVHDCGGRGFFHETPFGFGTDPEYDTTRYINCDAYNLADSLAYTFDAVGSEGNQADGFKEYGNGVSVIIYEGCRTWNTADDGWDTGSAQNLWWDNCWSFLTGWMLAPNGDGNGFKFGGHNQPLDGYPAIADTVGSGSLSDSLVANNIDIRHATNLIGAYNKLTAFFFLEYEDYWRSIGQLSNSIVWQGPQSTASFSNNALPGRETIGWRLYNNIFWNDHAVEDGAGAGEILISAPYKNYTEDHNNWNDISGYPGWEWNDTITVSAADFVYNVYDSTTLINMLSAPRNADGSLPTNPFLLAEGSDLLEAGRDVGMSNPAPMGVDHAWLGISIPQSPRRRIATSGGRPVVGLDGKKMILIE